MGQYTCPGRDSGVWFAMVKSTCPRHLLKKYIIIICGGYTPPTPNAASMTCLCHARLAVSPTTNTVYRIKSPPFTHLRCAIAVGFQGKIQPGVIFVPEGKLSVQCNRMVCPIDCGLKQTHTIQHLLSAELTKQTELTN